jgi:formylglycine-generating enzyme required for sulfatase activity
MNIPTSLLIILVCFSCKKSSEISSVIAIPTITSFSPISSAQGTTVTISGTNFTGATAVSFGGTAATSFSVINATTITAILGAGASGNVIVTTPGGSASLGGFVFSALDQQSNPQYGLVSTTSLGEKNITSKTQRIRFSLTWKNSWRDVVNYDGVWLFVKYKTGSNSWKHATLSTVANDHLTGSQAAAASISPASDGKGVYFYRTDAGNGDVTSNDVQLQWNYGTDGVGDNEIVLVQVYSIEMVYVPLGAFNLGDGSSIGRFHSGGNTSSAFLVTNTAINFGNSAGNLWADNTQATLPGGGLGPFPWDNPTGSLNANYPTGYNAFWMMKYEITMGQYADFLNSLPAASAQILITNSTEMATNGAACNPCRFNIQIGLQYSTTSPTRAMNWMQWQDATSFSDWAALRPMTELEFEKANRGVNQAAVAGEYSWGTTTIRSFSSIVGVDGSGVEITNPADANTHFSGFGNPGVGIVRGLVRVGIHQGKATRELRGESFYKVQDLSGNVVEMCITLGNANGRNYSGTNGNGELNGTGAADVVGWPLTTASAAQVTNGGWGFRGGDFWNNELDLRTSARNVATFAGARRLFGLGYRAVRTAN